MPTSKKPGTRRVGKRRSVSIGGVSQSAFAGYATTGQQQNPGSKTDVSQHDNQSEKRKEQDKQAPGGDKQQ